MFALFLIVLIFIIYSLGISHSVFGGDSGDIILASWFGGVAHPPGYPLNTMVGWIYTHIPYHATVAYKANLMSAVFQALSIGFLFLIVRLLTKNTLVSLAAVLTLAFTPLFWLYAHVAEVFQLTLVLVSLSLLFLFSWFRSKNDVFDKNLFFSVLFLGLASFHHHTAFLLLPSYIYILSKKLILKDWRDFMKVSFTFLAGLTPYIFTFFAAMRHTPINWDSPTNLKNFLTLVFRTDYGTFTAAPDLLYFHPIARLTQLVWYLKVIKADFTIIGLVFILIGFFYLFLKQRYIFFFLSLASVFTGPLFLAYASFPPVTSFVQGVSERFLLLNYLFLTIILAFGFKSSVEFFINFLSRYFSKINFDRGKFFVSLGLFAFPILLSFQNAPKADLSEAYLGRAIALDVLSSAEPPGIILLQGDTVTFNSQYYHYVEKVNNESKIILTGRLRRSSYRDELKIQYPDLNYPEIFDSNEILSLPTILKSFVHANIDKFPIYILEKLDVGEDLIWIKQGVLSKLYKKDSVPEKKRVNANIERGLSELVFMRGSSDNYSHFFEDDIRETYASIFTENGFELLDEGFTREALKLFEKALSIDENQNLAHVGIAISLSREGHCQGAVDVISALLEKDNRYWRGWEQIANVYEECFKDSVRAVEYRKRAEYERSRLQPQLREF